MALVVVAGCGSTRVTARQPYEGDKVAHPDRIIVHDFAATPADIPAGSAVAGEYAQTASEQILVANSEMHWIDPPQVLENFGCQLGQPSENEFATSIMTSFTPVGNCADSSGRHHLKEQ